MLISNNEFRYSIKAASSIYQKIKVLKTCESFQSSKFSLIKKGLAMSIHCKNYEGFVLIVKTSSSFHIQFLTKNNRSAYSYAISQYLPLLIKLLAQ